MKVVIVGAGITGLSAAYSLLKSCPGAEITVLESSQCAGGIVSTFRDQDCVIEEGPDSFLANKPWAIDLCKQLGLGDQIVHTNEVNRKALVASRGRLLPLPEGFILMAPTKIWPFIDSPILSLRGKLDAAAEMFRAKNERVREETLKQFVTRRFGSELFDAVAQPMLGGIYTGDPDKLSAQATMPQFVELEKKYGSVIKGLARERTGVTADGGARYSLFVTLKNGLQQLTDALVEAIGRDNLRLGSAVTEISKVNGMWQLSLSDGDAIKADQVIVAVPSKPLASMVESLDSELSQELRSIEHSSCVVLNLLFDESDIVKPVNGFGFVVPEVEQKSIIACSFISNKFAGRAPKGKVLLRVFMGGALHPDVFALSDGDLVKSALTDLHTYLGITNYPQRVWMKRWKNSMPQYHLGHLDLVERIKARFANLDGLVWAGSALQGVGIPDCVRAGFEAARTVSKTTESLSLAPAPASKIPAPSH